jgi:hypothetical protein
MQDRSRVQRNTIEPIRMHSFFAALDWFFSYGMRDEFAGEIHVLDRTPRNLDEGNQS